MTNFTELENATERSRERLLATPIITDCFAGRVDLPAYIGFLNEAYHHVKHTVPLLMACGSRLPQRLQWLQPALVKYIEEEHGHDQWILNDIAACSGDANATRNGHPLLATELMVSFAYDAIHRVNPISFFGMVYVLESTSAALASEAAQSLAGSLGLPPRAFTYLSSHGRVDQEHIGDLAGVINGLADAGDIHAVMHSAQVFYELYRGVFESIPRTVSVAEARAANQEVA